ncbi:hypothetical protein ACWGIU_02350 [Streptomyces sp. NPDC054840]
MATDVYGQGFQVAALTDPPNAQTLATNLALMAGQTVMRFTNAAARAAAITSPVAGMHAYLVTEKRLTYYDGTAWIIQNTNAFVYASATQSVLNNTATTININAAIVDDTAGLNVAGHYWQTPMAGVYRMTAMVSWVGGGGGWRTLWLNNNGVQIVGSQGGSVGGSVGTTQERTVVASLAAGRQISLLALQQSGSPLSTDLPGNVAGSIDIQFLHA